MTPTREVELGQRAWQAAKKIGNVYTKIIRGTYSFDTDRAASIIGKEIESAFHAGVDAAKDAIRDENNDCPNYCAATHINAIARKCGFVFGNDLLPSVDAASLPSERDAGLEEAAQIAYEVARQYPGIRSGVAETCAAAIRSRITSPDGEEK